MTEFYHINLFACNADLGYIIGMKLKTKIGQIFITHREDTNFVSVYEEAFSKQGHTLELFAVMEVDVGHGLNKFEKIEYEKLAQTLVSAFKKSYVNVPQIDSDSFERALAHANTSLSKLAGRSKINWSGKLHVGMAALYRNELFISVTGNAQVFLVRSGELNLLSSDIAEAHPRPVKLFSNYASGNVASGDRLLLSSGQLFNHLSLERLKEFLAEETLEESCQEIIASLAEGSGNGFAAFVIEIDSTGSGLLIPALPAPSRSSSLPIILTVLKTTGVILWSILVSLWDILTRIARSRKQKKILFAVTVILVLVLLANIAYGFIKKSSRERRQQANQTIGLIEEKINEAEAALIYNDEKRIISLIQEAEELQNKEKIELEAGLNERLNALKNKISKVVQVESPVVLTTFPNIPTDLIRSAQGFIGFNKDTGSTSFYNFVTGEVKALLKGNNSSDLLAGGFAGDPPGYLFLNRQGKILRLNLNTDELAEFGQETILDLAVSHVSSMAIFGEGNLARIYLVDTKQNQIWRSRVSDSGPAAAEKWLKDEVNLSETRNMAIDGSIYLQLPSRTEKFFNGEKQDFELSALVPPLENAGKVFTRADYESIYLLDPDNKRILIFNKNGKLGRQLTSEKFRELADIYVDEKNRIIYALSGSELLQMTLP